MLAKIAGIKSVSKKQNRNNISLPKSNQVSEIQKFNSLELIEKCNFYESDGIKNNQEDYSLIVTEILRRAALCWHNQEELLLHSPQFLIKTSALLISDAKNEAIFYKHLNHESLSDEDPFLNRGVPFGINSQILESFAEFLVNASATAKVGQKSLFALASVPMFFSLQADVAKEFTRVISRVIGTDEIAKTTKYFLPANSRKETVSVLLLMSTLNDDLKVQSACLNAISVGQQITNITQEAQDIWKHLHNRGLVEESAVDSHKLEALEDRVNRIQIPLNLFVENYGSFSNKEQSYPIASLLLTDAQQQALDFADSNWEKRAQALYQVAQVCSDREEKIITALQNAIEDNDCIRLCRETLLIFNQPLPQLENANCDQLPLSQIVHSYFQPKEQTLLAELLPEYIPLPLENQCEEFWDASSSTALKSKKVSRSSIQEVLNVLWAEAGNISNMSEEMRTCLGVEVTFREENKLENLANFNLGIGHLFEENKSRLIEYTRQLSLNAEEYPWPVEIKTQIKACNTKKDLEPYNDFLHLVRTYELALKRPEFRSNDAQQFSPVELHRALTLALFESKTTISKSSLGIREQLKGINPIYIAQLWKILGNGSLNHLDIWEKDDVTELNKYRLLSNTWVQLLTCKDKKFLDFAIKHALRSQNVVQSNIGFSINYTLDILVFMMKPEVVLNNARILAALLIEIADKKYYKVPIQKQREDFFNALNKAYSNFRIIDDRYKFIQELKKGCSNTPFNLMEFQRDPKDDNFTVRFNTQQKPESIQPDDPELITLLANAYANQDGDKKLAALIQESRPVIAMMFEPIIRGIANGSILYSAESIEHPFGNPKNLDYGIFDLTIIDVISSIPLNKVYQTDENLKRYFSLIDLSDRNYFENKGKQYPTQIRRKQYEELLKIPEFFNNEELRIRIRCLPDQPKLSEDELQEFYLLFGAEKVNIWLSQANSLSQSHITQ